MDIVRLNLVGRAAIAARELAHLHPDVEFTSGRRSIEKQAEAMAKNIARSSRQWIVRTYKASDASEAIQAWIDAHPEATTQNDLCRGIVSVMHALAPEDLGKLSKHLSGEAFDVKPVTGMWGNMLLSTLRRVVARNHGTLLEQEGGLTIWHAQF